MIPQSVAPDGEQVVDHDRLVRAVERADSEMDDAGRDPCPVVTGAADMAREPVEIGVREAQIGLLWGWNGGNFAICLDMARP